MLHHVIEKNELEMFYQPKVCMKTGNVLGFEALIRWIHPEKGFIRPDIFILEADKKKMVFIHCRKTKKIIFLYAKTNKKMIF